MKWPEGSKKMLDYCHYYISNGYPIFPIAPSTKIPLLSRENGGNGVYDATTDREQVDRWWNETPFANIGLATGSRVDVLDVDSYAGGEEELMKHEPLTVAVEAMTPRGGSHLFFAPSEIPLKNKARVAPGLDIRTFGGYVVAAPSSLKGIGKYTWKTEPLNGQVLPTVPQWMIDAGKREDLVDLNAIYEGNVDDGEKHQQIIKSIYFMRMKDFPIEVTKEIVMGSISKIDPQRLGRESTERAIRKYLKEIDNCYAKYRPGDPWKGMPVIHESGKGLAVRGFDIKKFGPKVPEYLIYPYFQKGKCVLLDADGGTNKSSLMLALAAAMSCGVIPMTGETCEPVRTLYLHKGEDEDLELATVYVANGGDLSMIDFYDGDLVIDDDGAKLIEETITDGGYGLVVVDALFYFLSALMETTNHNLPAMVVMERLNRVAQRTGAVFVDIRHTKKGNPDTKASDMGMGSVQFRNSHRGQLVARWHPDERGVVVVTDEKGSILNPRGPHFCFRRQGNEIQFIDDMPNPFEPSKGLETKEAPVVDPHQEMTGDALWHGAQSWLMD